MIIDTSIQGCDFCSKAKRGNSQRTANEAVVAMTTEFARLSSRLSRDEPVVLQGKPLGVLGATPGSWGTRLAQSVLRHTLTACSALVMPAPQLYLRSAAELFDAQGQLIDSGTRDLLAGFLASFYEWVRRQQQP